MAASRITESARGLFNTMFGSGSEATVDRAGDKSSEPAGKLGGRPAWIVNVIVDYDWVSAPRNSEFPSKYTVVVAAPLNSNTKDETAFNPPVQSGFVQVQVDLKSRMTQDVPVQLMNHALCSSSLEQEWSALQQPSPNPQALNSAKRRIQSHLRRTAAQCLREQWKYAADNKDGSCANTGDIPIFVAPHETTPEDDLDWSNPHRMTAFAIVHESAVRSAEDGDLTLLLDANDAAPLDAGVSTGRSTLRFAPDWSDPSAGIFEPVISCNLVVDHLKNPTMLPALKALQHLLWQTSWPATETQFPRELKTIEHEEIVNAQTMWHAEDLELLRSQASNEIEERSVKWLEERFKSLLSRDAETTENRRVLAKSIDFSGPERIGLSFTMESHYEAYASGEDSSPDA